jgi:hypothetical protein
MEHALGRQGSGAALSVLKRFRILLALAAGLAWGFAAGYLSTQFWVVAVGGLGAAAFAFWLERAALVGPETTGRKDFYLILACACGFFAVVGVGLVSVGYIIGQGVLHPVAHR